MSDPFHLTRDQAATIAAGLYQLAKSDGFDEAGTERALILSFLEDSGHSELIGSLEELHFDPASAYQTLNTSWLRKVFLQAAVILVRADGHVSAAERESLGWIASAFGVPGGVDALLSDTQGHSFAP